MKRKNIIIGIMLLSMLFLAACGEEKPLADRVIENLEDCMGAREVTEEEYAEIKRKKILYPIEYKKYLGEDNTYLILKDEDLQNADVDLSFWVEEDIEVGNAIMYKYENEIDDKNSYMTVFLYEFMSDEYANKYIEFLGRVWETYYMVVKENEIAQGIYPDDRKMGKVEKNNYIYQVIVSDKNDTSVDLIYCFWEGNCVMEVEFDGYEDNELYPKFKKFLKKMKFEGLNDIELEYAEPQSEDA